MDYATGMQELETLKRQVTSISAIVDSKERSIAQREQLVRQGQVPNNSAQNLAFNMRNNLSPMLTPGNIGDVNQVIWPFYFTTDIPDSPIGPNETFQTGFSVTQEAAFVFMSFSKAVYLVEGEDPNQSWTYLDPDAQLPSAPGLQFTLRDGSSSRQLFNTPMLTDHYGNPRFPTKFPRPVMLLPNQVMQIQFLNTDLSNSYVPFITAFGYRIRIDEAQKLLSLVYA